MPLHVSPHPVVKDCLAGLRDRRTPPEEFRALARRLITFLLYEATMDLPTQLGRVRTPLASAEVARVDVEVVAIPVLRAGLGLLGSGVQALDIIRRAGGRGTRMISVVAAPEGVRALEATHPDVHVYAAALDERLDDRAFIVPGLGDFGDRLFGTG